MSNVQQMFALESIPAAPGVACATRTACRPAFRFCRKSVYKKRIYFVVYATTIKKINNTVETNLTLLGCPS